jgi:hypothetical protein
LVERQGAHHRHQRDRIDAEAVLDDDGAPNLDGELGGQQRDRRAPHLLAGGPLTNGVQQTAHHECGDRNRREDLSAVLDQPGQPGSARMVLWFASPAGAWQGRCVGIAHAVRLASNR